MGNATPIPQTAGSPGVAPDVQEFTDCSDSSPSPSSPRIHGLFGLRPKSKQSNTSCKQVNLI